MAISEKAIAQGIGMQTPHRSPVAFHSASDVVRSLAKRLHRDATADSLSNSLPVLRRLLNAHVLHGLSLPQLRGQRALVQRKHLLRMLAVESGFSTWELYRHALKTMTEEQLAHFDVYRDKAGNLNSWFSSRTEAEIHALVEGGKVVGVGSQAVVLAEIAYARVPPQRRLRDVAA